MKHICLGLLLLLCGMEITAQTCQPVDAGSAVKFTIKNFGLNVTGSFTGLKGKIIFNPQSPGTASFMVSVNAATVNTGNGSRDEHLKKEDYFDATAHPQLTFTASKITAGAAGTFNMEGLLTIKGVTKNVSFPFTATPTATGYQFAGKFKINRRDFKVGGNSMVLADELTVSLSIVAVK